MTKNGLPLSAQQKGVSQEWHVIKSRLRRISVRKMLLETPARFTLRCETK
jgi:hypothetical protein